MTEKVLFTGKTHNTSGRDGAVRSSDGRLDLRMPAPHPAAEQFFGAAWSACFMAAIGVVAGERKITLPADPAIDAEIDLNLDNGAYFLRARLNVSVPGLDRELAQTLVEAAHEICPYSKATRGNIDVEITLV
jgi:osmotically inducible protein OsmC